VQCPRCGGSLHAPSLRSSTWRCDAHGEVFPLHPPARPAQRALDAVIGEARVPVWLPWPLPVGWVVTGACHAGDERSHGRAVALACSGPAPFGGVGEIVVVAEEPGVGLGARYAGIAGYDPGETPDSPAGAHVHAAKRPTSLWELTAATGRSAWVGEALGAWLWVVTWPETTDLVLHDSFELVDLRDAGHSLDLPFGALCPQLGAVAPID
jgi:hypothetical protein